LAKERMHASTAMDISKRLKNIISILERENTPKEYKKALEELRSLAKETRIDYARKPISRKAWSNLWAGVLGDFIGTFVSNAVNYGEDADEDHHEWFLRGMAKGMWTIYNMIEELMVGE